MKSNRDKRIVYWNRETVDPPENIQRWFFGVVNESKMIKKIQERIFEQLQPVEDRKTYKDSTIRGKDLRAFFFSVVSGKSDFDFQTAYRGRWKKEDDLYSKSELLMDRLINRLIS